MERAYNYIHIFFMSIFFVVVWGFWKTYIVSFPTFQGFGYTHHMHGLLMMLWIFMLIVQPLLIRSGKLSLHRAVGKASYFVVPLLLLSIFMVGKISYNKMIAVSPQQAIASLAQIIPALLAFAVLYGLAIWNKKKSRIHMRYMLGTSLLMIGPALGRVQIIFFNVPFLDAVDYANYLIIAIAFLLLITDIFQKKPVAPYSITVLVMVLGHLAWQFRDGFLWQAVGEKFATIFY
ncbi:hypothetical protein [Adhaeribacter pallidiroseus]|uniref:Uncharacterized protein n=1 Tax=Adhaeribacter pallidiroseus TaxID=2072847 RepID=A0A369QTV3_9BACT|nr:hypothetical protein [Adhaeribacter pallidiroseus]RDC66239.1 hypothetical protein AHMF7616_04870 [Adhaeribacter pallidiroseus]